MSKDTSGPAFPIVIDIGQGVEWHRGMSLRDYFAAKAMQAFIWRAVVEMDMEDAAIDAYEMADAMLKARET